MPVGLWRRRILIETLGWLGAIPQSLDGEPPCAKTVYIKVHTYPLGSADSLTAFLARPDRHDYIYTLVPYRSGTRTRQLRLFSIDAFWHHLRKARSDYLLPYPQLHLFFFFFKVSESPQCWTGLHTGRETPAATNQVAATSAYSDSSKRALNHHTIMCADSGARDTALSAGGLLACA